MRSMQITAGAEIWLSYFTASFTYYGLLYRITSLHNIYGVIIFCDVSGIFVLLEYTVYLVISVKTSLILENQGLTCPLFQTSFKFHFHSIIMHDYNHTCNLKIKQVGFHSSQEAHFSYASLTKFIWCLFHGRNCRLWCTPVPHFLRCLVFHHPSSIVVRVMCQWQPNTTGIFLLLCYPEPLFISVAIQFEPSANSLRSWIW